MANFSIEVNKSDKGVPIILRRLQGIEGFIVKAWDELSDDFTDALHPHRHDHYTCMLIEDGALEVLLDFEHFIMPAKTLFISPPWQVHQVLSVSKGSGWYISFENNLIEVSVRATLDKCLEEMISVGLTDLEFDWFKSVIQSIMALEEINSTTYKDVSHPLLSAFVAQAGLSYQSKPMGSTANFASRSVMITKKFMNLVRHNYHHLKRPADYAEKLHISVSYLNDTVKKTTNSSASLLIQKEILREAQRMLYYTDHSVKEISDLLGYEDEKYFMRLFRKKTGFSPTEYRKHNAPPSDFLL
ncbi:MAG: helix-turn-helix domain-containing protein [Flavobacterium sp.]|uniref:AraC family transcriptional regulator n=1 Tax=Flavobacterium sp. Leaf359 TaxID=1736351 RepID=UPI0006F2A889|nr:AraC family transcriptional regulator [Flavobacterium sp. Leaf359]KQS53273.1 hypothetical protein ASG38_00615 [Flavobacterium sp. Leaf359]MBU7570426.1 helix-turn-helix domain-containing protein [Flavobacterium sp.]PZO32489.1 MAG: AraC family transcriptional regulator [Flavobacteriaceae bacterium]